MTEKEIVSSGVKTSEYFFPCVYFLILGDEVVYVGQTTKGVFRIYQHTKNKIFDRVYFLKTDKRDLARLEAHYILKFKPKYNKEMNEMFVTIGMINTYYKKIFGKKNLCEIKKIIKENNIHPAEFNGICFYTRKERDFIISEAKRINKNDRK